MVIFLQQTLRETNFVLVRPYMMEQDDSTESSIRASMISRCMGIFISIPMENRFNAKNIVDTDPNLNQHVEMVRNAGFDLRRCLVFYVLYEAIYFNLKDLELFESDAFDTNDMRNTFMTTVLSGGLAGALIGGLTYPVDELKKFAERIKKRKNVSLKYQFTVQN